MKKITKKKLKKKINLKKIKKKIDEKKYGDWEKKGRCIDFS